MEFAMSMAFRHCLSTNADVWMMCSGGPDSMALLHYLHNRGVKLKVFHANHEDQAASDLLVKYTEEHGIPIVVRDCPYDTEQHMREFRYTSLCELRDRTKQSISITAHTLDDCLENMIMSMYRGEAHLLPYTTSFGSVDVYRPFILNTKQHILDYCHRHNVPYYECPSNSDPTFTLRNKVRSYRHVFLDIDPHILSSIRKRLINKYKLNPNPIR